MNDLRFGPEERAYVFAVVRRILRDEDAANDATQDALLLAYRHRAQFRGDSAFKTWLYRIAVMTALGYLRKQRRLSARVVMAPSDRTPGLDVPDGHPSPEADAAATELAGRLGRALGSINESHRRVFLLRAAEWRESEIARELGISIANVKIRLHRARAGVKAALGETSAQASVARRSRRESQPLQPQAAPASRAS